MTDMRRLAFLLALATVLAVGLATPPSAQTRDTHVVQAGETLFRISRTYGVDIDELRRINGIEGNYITVGQTLRLTARSGQSGSPAPRPPDARPPEARATPAVDVGPPDPPASDGQIHVVASGETLFRIALRYDTSVSALRRLNGIEGDQIEVGQRLRVSGTGAADGVAGADTPRDPAAPRDPATRPDRPAARPAVAQTSPAGAVALSERREWSINRTTVPADLVHFSEPGETLYGIAARYGVSLDALVAGNALSTAPLEPGTALRLPTRVRPSDAAQRTLPEPVASGLALVYPDVMSGRVTQSGEAYDPLAFTASHRDYPFGTVLLVTNPASGRSSFVRVIDRGPVSEAYLIELSAAAATVLELDPNAARRVEIREVP